jgi:hypothetical protein
MVGEKGAECVQEISKFPYLYIDTHVQYSHYQLAHELADLLTFRQHVICQYI